MRIQSLNRRDDVKKDAGSATVELSGLELIALNNILCKVAKESECDSEILFGMTRVVHTANSIVQHMKREDVKAKLPGITDEQLNWLMSENGADINREKTVAEQFKTQFENAQAQLKTAQDGLAKFDGKKTPDEYEAELTKLRGDMQAQADGFAFDSALNTAIMGKKGRSVKAVRALLDMEALKSSKDRTTDIDKALEEAAKANPWAFGEAAEGGVRVSSGAEHGTPPTGDTDAVTAAFKAMNPGIKID